MQLETTYKSDLIVSFRRSYYAANWASFTFNGLLNWIEQYHVSIKVFCYWRKKVLMGFTSLHFLVGRESAR